MQQNNVDSVYDLGLILFKDLVSHFDVPSVLLHRGRLFAHNFKFRHSETVAHSLLSCG